MTSYSYDLNLDCNFYQRSNLLIGCFGDFYLILFLSPKIKQQNTSYKKSVFVSMRQKAMLQSQCSIWQVNNHSMGGYIPGIIIKEAAFTMLRYHSLCY